jgi:hypothetical protein
MTSPKYDSKNYLKHSPIIIYKDDDYQKLENKFGSYFLLIKWKVIGSNKLPRDYPAIGTIKILQSTPLGDFEPQYFNLKVSPANKQYIQFLSLIDSGFSYTVEIKNPANVAKSQIEIWEFNNPRQIISSNAMPYYSENPIDLAPLTAATAANATALNAMATAIAAQPGAIADAAANNAVTPFVLASLTVGQAPASVLPADMTRQSLTAKNTGTGRIKLWIGPSLPGNVTNFNGKGFLVNIAANGTYEFVDPDQKSQVWAVSDVVAAELSLMGSTIT